MSSLFVDEFNGPAGARPDGSLWRYPEQGRGHYNPIEDDAENGGYYYWLPNVAYPDDPAFEDDDFRNYMTQTNAALDGNGALVLTGRREAPPDDRQDPWRFTGCRLYSRRRFLPPVRVSARIRFNSAPGTVGTFWLDGSDMVVRQDGKALVRPSLVWPRGGEIDIVERPVFVEDPPTPGPSSPDQVAQAIHSSLWPFDQSQPWGDSAQGGYRALPGGGSPSDGFHVYRIDWLADSITWFIDDVETWSVNRTAFLAAGFAWPFDRCPQKLILSMDVGRYTWTGDVLPEFTEDAMYVDYVRVESIEP